MKKKQCNNIRNNKRCKRDATYVCESIFGEVYYCSYHIKKKAHKDKDCGTLEEPACGVNQTLKEIIKDILL